MVLLQTSPEILRMSSNRKMLGSKGILTPMIHGLLRISCSCNPKNTSNPLIFLRKMATFGSKVCEPSKTADAVKFRNRWYSPDERR